MSTGKKSAICLLIMLVLISVDRITKHIVNTTMQLGEEIPSSDAFVRIKYVINDGISFSMLEGKYLPIVILQSALVVLILVILVVYLRKNSSFSFILSVILAGGIGNFWDRIAHKGVTDFISVGTFPIFNVADICVCVGSGLLLLYLIVTEIREKKAGTDHG
jgi:signal peptidase II